MGWVSGIVVFLMVWWTVLFTVLPFGVEREIAGPDVTAHGAPKNANMKKKALITTGISIVVWLIIYVLIDTEVISFREMADTMAKEDLR